METQRRSALKKLLAALTGLVAAPFLVKAAETPANVAGNGHGAELLSRAAPANPSPDAVPDQEVPLFAGNTKYNGLIFIAGKGAHFEGDIKSHTDHVLKELEKELILAGSSMEKVLKVTVFLNDIADYNGMNEIYKGRFGKKPPVRTTVAVAKGGVPGNSLVEMDCIAYA
ncbi:MAG TPA: RidA family protein [Puia sp.]|nr:RidA family protein [Puia sp.]